MKKIEDEPMSPSVGTTEDASMDSGENGTGSNKMTRVSWDKIDTREFALVVGDHPLCNDGLPVSLGWKYSDCCPNSLAEASEREQSYVFPRRLSYDERRQRLFLGGLSAEQVKNDEIDLVVRTLNEAWDHGGMQNSDLMDPLADITMLGDDDTPLSMDFDLGDISNFEWTD
jgi:hypothetical protein